MNRTRTGPVIEANETYSSEETVARREAALKRMLSTPHQPHKPLGQRKARKAPKHKGHPKDERV
jgi:hypothetical protein